MGSSGLLDILRQMSSLLGRQTSIGANTSSWFCLFRFPHVCQGREQWGEEGAGKEGTYTDLEDVPGSGPGALQKLPSLILQATIETASLISRFCRNLTLWELNCRSHIAKRGKLAPSPHLSLQQLDWKGFGESSPVSSLEFKRMMDSYSLAT